MTPFIKFLVALIVDLVTNLLTPKSIVILNYLPSRSKEARVLLDNKPLPSRPSKQLRQRLAQLRSTVVGLDTGLDLAVEVAPMEYTVTYKTDLEVVDVEIRDAFLHYFATIMGHYR